MQKLGTLWNVTPYPDCVTARTTLAAECDPHIADGRGYLIEANDSAAARAMAKEHYFQSRGFDPSMPLIWTRRTHSRPIMLRG
jgi:hypothetical protein